MSNRCRSGGLRYLRNKETMSEFEVIASNMFHKRNLISCQSTTGGVYYIDVIVGAMASQITIVSIVYSSVCSGADQRKHQSSVSLAFLRGNHRWPVNSPPRGPVTGKMVPFDDVIVYLEYFKLLIIETRSILSILLRYPFLNAVYLLKRPRVPKFPVGAPSDRMTKWPSVLTLYWVSICPWGVAWPTCWASYMRIPYIQESRMYIVVGRKTENYTLLEGAQHINHSVAHSSYNFFHAWFRLFKKRFAVVNVLYVCLLLLTHWSLVTPYGGRDLGQHWLR